VKENWPPANTASSADDTSHSRSELRCIGLENPREVAFWTAELAVTEAELREAVRKSGPVVKDVRRYISMVRRYMADVRSYLGGISGPA
jgi:hypothetical protein